MNINLTKKEIEYLQEILRGTYEELEEEYPEDRKPEQKMINNIMKKLEENK